jgi:hypothetical protein
LWYLSTTRKRLAKALAQPVARKPGVFHAPAAQAVAAQRKARVAQGKAGVGHCCKRLGRLSVAPAMGAVPYQLGQQAR